MEFSNSFILRCNLATLIFKALAIKSFEGGLINPSKNLSIRPELMVFSKKLETPNPEKKAKKKTMEHNLMISIAGMTASFVRILNDNRTTTSRKSKQKLAANMNS
ncbi:hypothetical protein [Chromobacterium haemolyticum]|uniref:hypothetical protein n=1 Tax=Chromobacterium haemolyticum TaxID=394935 RepID=UPI0011B29899|nr:hypothetical protein [Chromobacterium haemolyticum]